MNYVDIWSEIFPFSFFLLVSLKWSEIREPAIVKNTTLLQENWFQQMQEGEKADLDDVL